MHDSDCDKQLLAPKAKAKTKANAKAKPVILGYIEVNKKETDSYLGNKLCSKGLGQNGKDKRINI